MKQIVSFKVYETRSEAHNLHRVAITNNGCLSSPSFENIQLYRLECLVDIAQLLILYVDAHAGLSQKLEG